MAVWPLLLALAVQDSPRIEKVEIPDSKVSFELVKIQTGSLQPVWMGRREISWKEFDLFYNENEPRLGVDGVTRPSKGKPYFAQVGVPNDFLNPDRPVTCLRWHAAIAYCDWLSRRTGSYYRLPTEAEWEAACRAGRQGTAPKSPADVAWFGPNSAGKIHDVGTKKANPFGIYDMLGNVWEYCLEQDKEPEFGPILRGGAFKTPASQLTYSARTGVPVKWFSADPMRPRSVWWLTNEYHQGFRVVRIPDATVETVTRTYAGKIKVAVTAAGNTRLIKARLAYFTQVTGEIRNDGDRSLAEVELQVYPLNPEGKPMFLGANAKDVEARGISSKCWPVLANGSRFGDRRAPLAPGAVRKWTLEVPGSLDGEDVVAPGQFGARVTAVRFSAKN